MSAWFLLLNFVFVVWWKTSSSATFYIFVAINFPHIGTGINNVVHFKNSNSPKSSFWLERRFAASDWLTGKPDLWVSFYLGQMLLAACLRICSNRCIASVRQKYVKKDRFVIPRQLSSSFIHSFYTKKYICRATYKDKHSIYLLSYIFISLSV